MNRWIARHSTRPEPDIESARIPGVPDPVALVLARRGFAPASAARFLEPSPSDLSHWSDIPGMEDAARLIAEAAAAGARILVWGDFDADGLTASAILHGAVERAGGACSVHIPDRMGDGYGLGVSAVEVAKAVRADLLVTVDCGISACDGIAALEAAGIRTVVTDHHEPGGELPAASAVVDPCMHGRDAPWSFLSGSGTALMLGRALDAISGSPPECDSALALACVGTICDVVPLSGDNRTIARLGLEALRRGSVPGLSALASRAGFDIEEASGTDVSFRIGPRLNSCGRIATASPALDLLLSGTFEEAVGPASELEAHNDARRLLDRKVFDEASRMAASCADDPAVVLASPSWHKGVIGIAASRLASELDKPVILCAVDPDGGARGSARGVPGLNLFEILSSMSDMLGNFGGHAGAAGLEFRFDSFGSLKDRFCGEVAARSGDREQAGAILLDGRLRRSDLTQDLVEAISRMEPFGEGNEEPVWITGNSHLLDWSRVGGGEHLSCRFSIDGGRFQAIGFGMGRMERPAHGPLDLAYCLRLDTFRGRRELRLHLRDIRPARSTDGRA